MFKKLFVELEARGSRDVAVSISDGVTEIFHWHNPSGRTMALRSIQPLIEMSTRRQVPRADNLGTFVCRLSRNSWCLNLLEPKAPVQTSNGIPLPLLVKLDKEAMSCKQHYVQLQSPNKQFN